MKRLILLLLLSLSAFAGQSLQLSSSTVAASVPNPASGTQWRAEFNIHDWPTSITPGSYLLALGGQFEALVYGAGVGSISFQIYNATDGATGCAPTLTGLSTVSSATGSIIVRFQHDGVGGYFTGSKSDNCQVYDAGTGQQVWGVNNTFAMDSSYPFSGLTLFGMGAGKDLSWGYFRIINSLVPANATPPVTAAPATGSEVYWKFDGGNNTGSQLDLSVNGYNVAFSGSTPSTTSIGACGAAGTGASPAYCNTPYQQPFAAVCAPLQCANALAWSSAAPAGIAAGSMQVGGTGYVDGSNSYSQIDMSPTVTCSASLYSASISGATVATPIVVTVGSTTNIPAYATIAGVAGNTAANGTWPITVLTGTTFSIPATGNSAYTSGGAVTGGPNAPTISTSGCLSTITGQIFGDYPFLLTVTDGASNTAFVTLDVGSVNYNSQGIVTTGNTIVDALIGEQIAYGQNPWGFQDYWHVHAASLRTGDYAATQVYQNQTYPGWSTNGKPQWETLGAGTVSYFFNGSGQHSPVNLYYLNSNCGLGACGTNLSGSCTSTAASCGVVSCAGLDFTSTPTRIVIDDGTNWDEDRATGCSGNTITFAYDPSALPRHSFATGVNVLQSKVSGTSTKFVTDLAVPLCPLGAPGLPGVASYSTGAIGLVAGSNVGTAASGAVWTNDGLSTLEIVTGGNLDRNNFIQVSATHSTTPFTFMAQNTTGGAYALAALSGGTITSVSPGFTLTGQNYIGGHVNVVITDSTGSGAAVTANVVGGAITSYTVTSAGSGYTNPTLFVSPTEITLSRVYPSDADTGTFSPAYVMPATRTLVLHYTNSYTDNGTSCGGGPCDSVGDSQLMFGATGCESDTDAYINPGGANNGLGNQFTAVHDVTGLDGTLQSGKKWSVTDTTYWINQTSTGGINFYGENIASTSLYWRSGLNLAKHAESVISDYWLHSPWGTADGNGWDPLFVGGGVIGSWISYLTDPQTKVSISNLRAYANKASGYINDVYIGMYTCNNLDDTRDFGYLNAMMILAAIYDPDTTGTLAPGGISWRAYWQGFIAQMQSNDSGCENQTGAANSVGAWANGFLWNASFPVLTMTNGSAVATGTGLPNGPLPGTPFLCNNVASGTATATQGSNMLTSVSVSTGSLPSGFGLPCSSTGGPCTTNIFLTGTTGSGASVFVQNLVYAGTSSPLTLGGYWQGDTGTVTWQAGQWDGNPSSGNPADMMSIAMSENDSADLRENWGCIWNSSTQITLNRPWNGATTDGTHIFRAYVGNLSGYGQQPFMLGIKSYGMNLLAKQTVAALSSYVAPYSTFVADATSWIWNAGMDHQFFGTNYGRIFQVCEPTDTAPITGTTFTYRAPGCTYGPQLSYLSTEQNSETGAAHAIYYTNNPTGGNQALGDEFYGSLWGLPAYTTGAVYASTASTASNAAQSNLSDSSIHGGKWYGFFTGVGFSSRWAAIRQAAIAAAGLSRNIAGPGIQSIGAR